MPHERLIKVEKVAPNSFAAVVHSYMASPKFKGYAAATQEMWGSKLRQAARADLLGSISVKEIRPSLVQAFLDRFAYSPSAQAVALAAIRQLEKWAIVRDLLPRAVTTGCEIEEFEGGHLPWTNEQIAIGEGSAAPELARVITMAVNTGQRGSDLVRMRWTDIDECDGRPGITVTQQKTGKTTWVPFTRELSEVLARWERRPGFILLRDTGMPWGDREVLTRVWGAERDSNPALAPLRAIPFKGKVKDLVIHGLRGAACVRLLRANINTRGISDMIGMSEEMVKRYTRFSEQKHNAIAAVIRLDRTPHEPTKIDNKKIS